ncbi:MAG: hydantoinase B/oxoprolinase family protein [Lentisphaeraceae bacterium]|nr:hydantoinase B/oxoprolinase family protein [Lentisphaeraceae bacterium]
MSDQVKKDMWQFRIDVGGTFTDYVASSPSGECITGKILSSGIYKSTANVLSNSIHDESLNSYPKDFFKGFKLRIQNDTFTVESFKNGSFVLGSSFKEIANQSYEIFTGEEAPVMAIRLVTQTSLEDPFPSIDLRLGTTRGTNALLERKGAKVALICTKGFKDVWTIGTQARPDLFALEIHKPEPLVSLENTFEVTERVSANGEILTKLDENELSDICQKLKSLSIDSVAVCLLNSYKNSEHELKVYEALLSNGLMNVSVSSTVSPTIKYLDRGDTCIVDAYLSPIIRSYVSSIKASLPEAKLRLITSSGALVSAENFSGKDSLLSGPAGGVNGFVHAARSAGFEKSIGFDMGGTSTDVKRYGGEFEYQYETEKAGVRVVTPMYAIETVAAGGGSICRYDGQRFLVGPESAGANPGPACYGNGGPLTVTDINLFSGKIDAEAFPFQMDKFAVEEKLKGIQKELKLKEDISLSLHEISDGFTKIADFKMAEAIKEISASKGYEPADHAMVAFGGAGPQHACSIADILNIPNILIHPFSGILSAYGIGITNIHFFEEKSILKLLDKEGLSVASEEIEKLKEIVKAKMLAEDIREDSVTYEIYYDLRYTGENECLTVEAENAKENFEKKHLQFFGYNHESREIELHAVRVKGLAKGSSTSEEVIKPRRAANSQDRRQSLHLNGETYDVKVRARADLEIGDELEGPILLTEGLSSIVVEKGWMARVDKLNNLILSKQHTLVEKSASEIITKDPIRLELFNNIFTSIAYQMGEVLRRISLSVNIKERLDFSCAVLDKSGDLIVNAPHIPVHLGALSDCVRALIDSDKELKSGDVYLTNDPGTGGSHLPDLTVISPVFDVDGKDVLFFTAIRAHHSEIGGIKPGSFCPFAKCLEEEGVIFRNFILADKAGFKEQELRRALTDAKWPSRSPNENVADLKAAQAAVNFGNMELVKVLESYGQDLVLTYMGFMKQTAADKTLEKLLLFKDLNTVVEDALDDGSKLMVKLSFSKERLLIDFTGTAEVHPNTMNANKAIVKSAILYVLRCIIDEDIPLNEGVLQCVDLVLPECLLNPVGVGASSERAAVSAGNVELSQKVCDLLFKGFGVVAGGQGTMNNVIFGDQSFGFYETLGGGCGATQNFPGASAVHSHMTNTRLTDIEVIEKNYPVLIKEFGIRRNSGGEGLHDGGNGLYRVYEFLADVDLSLITQRRVTSPYALDGAGSGSSGKNLLLRNGEVNWQTLSSVCQEKCSLGDCLKVLTPGGGGFGRKR